MPNKIPLSVIQAQLPAFVSIIPESYRGKRYLADFIDLDYGEPFRAIVAAVIKHQHGCAKRANARRSKPYGSRKTLADMQACLPAYLTIYPESWRGCRHKARFRDTEYGEDFEAYCFNVLRDGKGYCPGRKRAAFRQAVMLEPRVIQDRLDRIYGNGFVTLEPSTYQGTGKLARFMRRDGKQVTCNVDQALQGMLTTNRGEQAAWRETVLERDGYRCRITGKPGRLHVHHIRSKSSCPELRFNVSNGIALEAGLHTLFHSRHGKTGNDWSQLAAFARGCGVELTENPGADSAPGAMNRRGDIGGTK